MQCHHCVKGLASAKVGVSKGNIFKALLGLECWTKKEIYLCKRHYNEYKEENNE